MPTKLQSDMRKMMYVNHVIGRRDGDALSSRLSGNSFLTSRSEWKQSAPRQSRELWMNIHSKDRCERVLLQTFFLPEGKQQFGTTCRSFPRLCELLEAFIRRYRMSRVAEKYLDLFDFCCFCVDFYCLSLPFLFYSFIQPNTNPNQKMANPKNFV